MTEEQKEKARIRARAWNAANPERAKANAKRWRDVHQAEIAEQARAKYAKSSAPARKAQGAFYAKHPWYARWQNARQRCENPKSQSYKYYGARGIRFNLTKDDMEFLWNRDASGLKKPSIDRIDGTGDYTRDNCRFIENDENRRRGAIDSAARRCAANRAPARPTITGQP